MEYNIVSRREVCEVFLELEVSRDNEESEFVRPLLLLKSVSDEDFFARLREYADSRHARGIDTNPVLVWTVGVGNDTEFRNVAEWRFQQVKLDELYSCGVNEAVNKVLNLDTIQGNLRRFTDILKAENPFTEFRLNDVPSDESERTLIGVGYSVPQRHGSIQLIDGTHRAVSMLANGIIYAPAYIAILKR